MAKPYRYTQIGTVTIIMVLLAAVLPAIAFYFALETAAGQEAVILQVSSVVVALFFIAVLATFYAFHIQVDDQAVTHWFGWGFLRKSIPLEQIESVEIVDNPWYYFWGVKSIPGGWFYAIAPGGRSIELNLKDGKKIRLGSRQPEAIKARIAQLIAPH